MMICPETYVEQHKHETYEQLIETRDEMIEEIRDLEVLISRESELFEMYRDSPDDMSPEDNAMLDAWLRCPGPDVQYQCCLDYLADLCRFMKDKYNREFVHKDDYCNSPIRIHKIGITDLDVDVIVNAANDRLAEGSGVCGAIFREAGEAELREACNAIGGCRTGDAVITPGFGLQAKYIIHAVGPIWRGGDYNEDQLLYSAYKKSLNLAMENDCHSIGFPLISAGIFGYPKDKAWNVAIKACKSFVDKHPDYELEISFAVIDDDVLELGESVLDEYQL